MSRDWNRRPPRWTAAGKYAKPAGTLGSDLDDPALGRGAVTELDADEFIVQAPRDRTGLGLGVEHVEGLAVLDAADGRDDGRGAAGPGLRVRVQSVDEHVTLDDVQAQAVLGDVQQAVLGDAGQDAGRLRRDEGLAVRG